MTGRRVPRRAAVLAAMVMATAVIAGCSEKLEAGAACPVLCPRQSVVLHDTILDAIVIDTSIVGIPPIGGESYLLLTNRPDSAETRVIVRFDTLPQTYRKTGASADSTITRVDSAYIKARLVVPTVKPTTPVTVELYDVDTTAADTVAAGLLPLFRPDRFLGSQTFAPESLTDTVRVPISNAAVLDRLTRGAHLRVGFLLATPGVDLRFLSTEFGAPMTLSFRATPDTTTPRVSVSLVSRTPSSATFLQTALSDYVIVARASPQPPAGVLALGGVPSSRAYIRFDLPSAILDSTTVVRATLLLTQRPAPSVSPHDTVTVYPHAVLSSDVVTDVATAVQFL
jgi:hypothetical protein